MKSVLFQVVENNLFFSIFTKGAGSPRCTNLNLPILTEIITITQKISTQKPEWWYHCCVKSLGLMASCYPWGSSVSLAASSFPITPFKVWGFRPIFSPFSCHDLVLYHGLWILQANDAKIFIQFIFELVGPHIQLPAWYTHSALTSMWI